jgi:phage/plasmid-like protein (TIGR03299 family)
MSAPDYGKYAVAYRNTDGPAWMGLPGAVTTGNVEEMFVAAGLNDWNVRARELITDARVEKNNPDFEVIRDNPDDGGLDRLHVAKKRYTPVQNEDVKGIAKNITSGDITADAMGAYKGGRRVFMSFTLGDDIVLDPEGQADKIGRNLTLLTSHDGSLSIMAMTHDFRLLCQNQLTSVKHSALGTYKVRHTSTAGGRLVDARNALSIGFKASDALKEDMERLLKEKETEQTFWTLVTDLFPKPEEDVKGSLKKWETRTDRLMDLWKGQAVGGNTVANLEDTRYKAYNVLNEDLFWYTSVRKDDETNALVRAAGFDDFANKANLRLYKAVADR